MIGVTERGLEDVTEYKNYLKAHVVRGVKL